MRFWLDGERPALYAFLRSPYAGLARKDVDWIEELRGRGIRRGDRAVEVTVELRDGRALPALEPLLRDPRDLRRAAARRDAAKRSRHVRAAAGPRARSDLQAHDAVVRTLGELDALASDATSPGRRAHGARAGHRPWRERRARRVA